MNKKSLGLGLTLLAVLTGSALLPGTQSAWADDQYQWTWMKGNLGVWNCTYGTLGTAAVGNTPGARRNAVSWTDNAGKLWLFGGDGYDVFRNQTILNDLWQFDRSTGNWTWMKGADTGYQPGVYGTLGTAAATNTPGARRVAVSWTDTSGALWLFGGYGYSGDGTTGQLNDLWKYDPKTGNWTWIKGASTAGGNAVYGTLGVAAAANTPGARASALAWTDPSGALWLYGGYDSAGYLSDLWKYNPATGNWTWMQGGNATDQLAVYGTILTPAAANTPGGRMGAATWTDPSGVLWLFGGRATSGGDHNDLWKYDPATNNWTWMKGANTVNQFGTYGTLGTAAPGNTPGARTAAVAWIDRAGALCLFGGKGYDGATGIDALNDLWKYDRTTGNWTWMNGASTTRHGGIYGTLGTPAASNYPGTCYNGVSWMDPSGALWIFSGFEYMPSQGTCSTYNVLWRWQDAVGPEGSILINGNRSTTNTRNVTLALTWSDGTDGSGVARMRFSDDGSTWSAYESLTPSKSYTLPVGDDGYRTVRVQFIDLANNRSATCSDYIRLDRSVPTGAITINNGASTTTTRSVTLKLNYADTGSGVARMRFSDNGSTWTTWLYPAATKAYTLPAGLGYHTVRAQYLDGANNYSPVYNDYIKLVTP